MQLNLMIWVEYLLRSINGSFWHGSIAKKSMENIDLKVWQKTLRKLKEVSYDLRDLDYSSGSYLDRRQLGDEFSRLEESVIDLYSINLYKPENEKFWNDLDETEKYLILDATTKRKSDLIRFVVRLEEIQRVIDLLSTYTFIMTFGALGCFFAIVSNSPAKELFLILTPISALLGFVFVGWCSVLSKYVKIIRDEKDRVDRDNKIKSGLERYITKSFPEFNARKEKFRLSKEVKVGSKLIKDVKSL